MSSFPDNPNATNNDTPEFNILWTCSISNPIFLHNAEIEIDIPVFPPIVYFNPFPTLLRLSVGFKYAIIGCQPASNLYFTVAG